MKKFCAWIMRDLILTIIVATIASAYSDETFGYWFIVSYAIWTAFTLLCQIYGWIIYSRKKKAIIQAIYSHLQIINFPQWDYEIENMHSFLDRVRHSSNYSNDIKDIAHEMVIIPRAYNDEMLYTLARRWWDIVNEVL